MQQLEQPPKDFSHRLIEWLAKLRQRVYDSIDSDNFIGTEWDDLTDGGDTVIHKHDRYEDIANKDVSGGYVGKTLEKINFWNTARTFMSFFTNAATAVRTYTFPDKDGTVAMTNDKLSAFAATTSAELAGIISDETGSGSVVFSTSPTLVSPILGTPTSGTLDNCTTNTEVAGTNNTHLASTAHVFAERSNTATLTNKTITLDSNTVSGTLAQLNTAITDADIARTDAGQTFTGNQIITGDLSNTGNTTLGNASTDLVSMNGYVGIGGGPTPERALSVTPTALTGTQQYGIVSIPKGNTSATVNVTGVYSRVDTSADVFTFPAAYAFRVADAVKGAGSTITIQHGLFIIDLTQGVSNYGITSLVSSGTNKRNLSITGTADNVLAGNTRLGGTALPTVACDVTGAVLATTTITSSGATSGVGYTTGAGGTVTQATSKATGVTLNKVTGAITMDAASLAATTGVSFVLTNSAIAESDVLDMNHKSGGTFGAYHIDAQCAAGSATIHVYNRTAGALAEAIVIQFVLHKGVTA